MLPITDVESAQSGARGERLARRSLRGQIYAAVGVLLVQLACGSTQAPPAAPLRLYTPEQAAVFNDVFRPELFGQPGDSEPNRFLAELVALADVVAPARVVTLTRNADGEKRSYTVVVAPIGPALLGSGPASSVSLHIPGTSPVFSWVDAAGPNWVGSRILIFLRFFEDGPHFHAAPDTREMRALVMEHRPVDKGGGARP